MLRLKSVKYGENSPPKKYANETKRKAGASSSLKNFFGGYTIKCKTRKIATKENITTAGVVPMSGTFLICISARKSIGITGVMSVPISKKKQAHAQKKANVR